MDVNDWVPPENKKQLIADLEKFYRELVEPLSTRDKNKAHIIQISEYLQILSTKLTLDNYWQGTSNEQIEKLIELFARFSGMGLYSYTQIISGNFADHKSVPTREVLMATKWLTLSDKLNSMYTMAHGPNIPSMYDHAFGQYLFQDLSIVEIYDPIWHDEIKAMQSYWKQRQGADKLKDLESAQSFFDFNDYPSGSLFSAGTFRYFEDPEALIDLKKSLTNAELHAWRALTWTEDWMLKQPGYAPWLKQALEAATKERITPIRLGYPSEYSKLPWKGGAREISRIHEPLLLRQEAWRLLSVENISPGDTVFPKQDNLPSIFYDLRSSAFVTNLFLTKYLFEGADFSIDTSNQHALKLAVTKGSDETIGFQRRVGQTHTHTVREEVYNPKTREYERQDLEREIPVYGSYEHRSFRPKFKIFGWGLYDQNDDNRYASEEVHEDDGTGVKNRVHVSNAGRPFWRNIKQKEEDEDHRSDLMRTYSEGLVSSSEEHADYDFNAIPKRKRLADNTLILTSPDDQGVKDVSLEEMRALLSLSSNPKTQIIKTLSFFDKNSSLLAQPEYQVLFEKLVFEPVRILEQLSISNSESALFINILADFCKRHYDSFKTQSDYKSMAFILEVNQYFQIYLNLVAAMNEVKLPLGYINPLMDSASTLLELIGKLNEEQWQIQSYLYLTLAGLYLYVPNLTEADCENLLLGFMQHKILAIKDKEWTDPYLEGQVKEILFRKNAAILKMVDVPGRLPVPSTVLASVTQRIRRDLLGETLLWRRELPSVSQGDQKKAKGSVFRAEISGNRHILIDVYTGSFFESGQAQIRFPMTTTEYQKIFKDPPPEKANLLRLNAYAWRDPATGDECRMEIRGQVQIIQRKIDGIWYEYEAPGSEGSWSDESTPKSNQYFSHLIRWKALSGDKAFRFEELESKQFAFESSYADYEETGKREVVVRKSDGSILHNTLDPDTPFAIFKALEVPQFIYVWLKPGFNRNRPKLSDVVEVQMPRLGLTFMSREGADGMPYLTCGDWRKFKVKVHNYDKYLNRPVNYLSCKPIVSSVEEVDESVSLLPLTKYAVRGGHDPLRVQFFPLRSSNPNEKLNVLSYLSNENQLLNLDLLSSFYLAYRYVFQYQYEKARELLLTSVASPQALSKQEKHVLRLIVEANNRDESSQLAGIQTMAGGILLRDEMFFHHRKIADDQLLLSLAMKYQKYLSAIHLLPEKFIPETDEIIIGKSILGQIEVKLSEKEVKQDKKRYLEAGKRIFTKRLEDLGVSGAEISGTHAVVNSETSNFGRNNFESEALFDVDDFRFRRWFESTEIVGVTKTGVLDVGELFEGENFQLIYGVAVDDPEIDYGAVRTFLNKLFEGDVGYADATQKELRDEIVLLLQWGSMKGQLDGERDLKDREKATFLYAVAKAKDAGSSFPSVVKVKEIFEQIDSSIREANKLSDEANLVWRKYYNTPDTEEFKYEKRKLQTEYSRLYWTADEAKKNPGKLIDAAHKLFDGVENYAEYRRPDLANHINQVSEDTKSPAKKILPHSPLKIAQGVIYARDLPIEDPLRSPLFSEKDRTTLFSYASYSEDQVATLKNDKAVFFKELDRANGAAGYLREGIEQLKLDTSKYVEDNIKSSKEASVVSWTKLMDKKTELQKGIKQSRLDFLEENILKLGKKYASELFSSARLDLMNIAKMQKEIELEDILFLVARDSMIEFFNLKGSLDAVEITMLYDWCVEYLLLSTHKQQVERFASTVDTLQTNIDKLRNKEWAAPLVQQVATLAASKRSYDPKYHKSYLVFEYFMNLLIRDAQVKSLDKLNIQGGEIQNPDQLGGVLEMIMGAGKTSVLLPLLSAMNTKLERLNMVVLPEPLLASMSAQLAEQMKTVYGRSVEIFSVSRETYVDKDYLEVLYKRFESARINKKTIVTTNSTIQSFFLHFIEKLYRYDSDFRQVDVSVTWFRKIFALWQEQGSLTIDEVDLALDILQAHQFSVGKKRMINHAYSSTVFALYRLLATDPSLNSMVDLPFLPWTGGGEPLTIQSYDKLKQALVLAIIGDPEFFHGFPRLSRAYEPFVASDKNKELIQKYLIDMTGVARKKLFEAIDSEGTERMQHDLKNAVSVLYDELSKIFLLTAVKKNGIHYGEYPKPEMESGAEDPTFKVKVRAFREAQFIALPYHAGTAMTTSRFGTELEALNYAIQLSLERQNYADLVGVEVKALKKRSKLAKTPGEKAKLQARVKHLLGDSTATPLLLLNEDEVEAIAARIVEKNEVGLKLALIKDYVLPQIVTYETQLQTSAQVYASLFNQVQGFSGTLWSHETFPKIFDKPELSDTTEKTLFLLWQQAEASKLASTSPILSIGSDEEKDVGAYVAQIYAGWDTPGSFIDEAGLFRGVDNEVVAKQILSQPNVRASDKIERVAYYDALGHLKTLDKSGRIEPLRKPSIKDEKRIAFWDKKHTTGSDIALRADMEAKLSIDHHLFSRDLQQSAWRLRGLAKGQRVVQYVVLEEDEALLTRNLNILIGKNEAGESGKFNTGSLLLYSVLNQENRLADLIYRAMRHKMKNTIANTFLKVAFDLDVSNRKVADNYNSIRFLFERTQSDHIYNLAGLPDEVLSKDEALKKDKEKLFKSLGSSFLSSSERQKIEAQVDGVIATQLHLLPDEISFSTYEDGQENEVELEEESEEEVEQEVDTSKEDLEFNSNHKPHEVLGWLGGPSSSPFRASYFDSITTGDLGRDPANWLWKKGADEKEPKINPVLPLADAFLHENMGDLASATDSNILISLNFAPLHHRNRFSEDSHYVYDFFQLYHKAISSILVIEDVESHGLKLLLCDANDVQFFDTFLSRDSASQSIGFSGRENRLALYDLELGIFRQGADQIDEAALESNGHFLEMLVQIKFFNGELIYDKDERHILKDWIRKNEPLTLFELFKDNILGFKRDSREQFRHSNLYEIFDELIEIPD